MEPMSPRQRRIVLALGLGFMGFFATLQPSCGGFEPFELPWAYVWFGNVLLGQPCLLAVWAAFSRQPLAVRLPRALGLSALLSLLLAWSQRHTPAVSVSSGIDTCALVVSLFLEFTLLLTFVRWRFGWRIERLSQTVAEPEAANQFSLQQLLTWTTGAAAVLALVRWLDQESPDWYSLAAYTTILSLMGSIYLLCVVPCLGCVLSRTSQRRFAVWALFTAVLGAILQYAASLASDHLGMSLNLDWGTIVFLDVCYVLTVVAGLGVFRLCGYHLIRGTAALATENVIPGEPAVMIPSSRWRSPFPYLVAILLLLTLLLARPAWQIEQRRRQYRADWWAARAVPASGDQGRF